MVIRYKHKTTTPKIMNTYDLLKEELENVFIKYGIPIIRGSLSLEISINRREVETYRVTRDEAPPGMVKRKFGIPIYMNAEVLKEDGYEFVEK